MKMGWQKGLTDPKSGRLNGCLSACVRKGTRSVAHRSRGRLEDLRFTACITVDMRDFSIPCAAQMVEIDSSKEVGSLMIAGTRLFNSSALTVGSEAEAEVAVGRVG